MALPTHAIGEERFEMSVTNESDAPPAVIGPGIVLKGEVSGAEDLLVEGRVEGTISLAEHRVVVGEQGRVAASIHARSIEIFGVVEGDLKAEEQVVLRGTGTVDGNITAPRVAIEDGSRFRGTVEMDVRTGASAEARKGVTKPVMMAAAEKFTAEKF